MTASILNFSDYRAKLRPSIKSDPGTLATLLLSERQYGERLPFVSAWPVWEGGRDLP